MDSRIEADTLKTSIDHRLNEHLCGMKPECDDSITGFNEALDIVREVFREVFAKRTIHSNIQESATMSDELRRPLQNGPCSVRRDGGFEYCRVHGPRGGYSSTDSDVLKEVK